MFKSKSIKVIISTLILFGVLLGTLPSIVYAENEVELLNESTSEKESVGDIDSVFETSDNTNSSQEIFAKDKPKIENEETEDLRLIEKIEKNNTENELNEIVLENNSNGDSSININYSVINPGTYYKGDKNKSVTIRADGIIPDGMNIGSFKKFSNNEYGFTVILDTNLRFISTDEIIDLIAVDENNQPIQDEESYGYLSLNEEENTIDFIFYKSKMMMNKIKRSFGFEIMYNVTIPENSKGNELYFNFKESNETSVTDMNTPYINVLTPGGIPGEGRILEKQLNMNVSPEIKNIDGIETFEYGFNGKESNILKWRLIFNNRNNYKKIILKDTTDEFHSFIENDESFKAIGSKQDKTTIDITKDIKEVMTRYGNSIIFDIDFNSDQFREIVRGEIHYLTRVIKPTKKIMNSATLENTDNEEIISQDAVLKSGNSGWAQAYDKNKLGKIIVTKIDKETEEPLEGVEFKILDKNKDEIIAFEKNFSTDKNGEITIDNLPEGLYYLQEIKALDGYKIENEFNELDVIYTKTDENNNFIFEQTITNIKKVPLTPIDPAKPGSKDPNEDSRDDVKDDSVDTDDGGTSVGPSIPDNLGKKEKKEEDLLALLPNIEVKPNKPELEMEEDKEEVDENLLANLEEGSKKEYKEIIEEKESSNNKKEDNGNQAKLLKTGSKSNIGIYAAGLILLGIAFIVNKKENK